MTRDDVARTLRMNEHCRELSYEANSKREEGRLVREYKAMWKAVEPYVSGTTPYADDTP